LQITAQLRELLKQDSEFKWTGEYQKSFEALKETLSSTPVLVLPRFDKPFILTMDASTTGLAYILSQKDEYGREQVVSYGGRGVRPAESKWRITELEMLVVEGTKHFHT